MENKVDNKVTGSTVAITGAIITAIAGIITTIVSISGPIIDRRMAIQTTQTREAFVVEATRVAGIAFQVTDTPMPVMLTVETADPTQAEQPIIAATPDVQPPQAFTATPVSEENSTNEQPQANNPPSETMLKVGESWDMGNGISVELTDIEVPAGNEVHLHFAFTNTSNRVIKIKVDHNRNVTLTDDKGNSYKWASEFTWEVSIQPGTTRKDEVKRRGDVSLSNYFVVKLELPGIGSAQWKD